MSNVYTPILMGMVPPVSEILLLLKTAKFPFRSMGYIKFLPLMNFISRTVHRILKSFTPKNCNFFSIFWYNFKILRQNFQFMHPCFLFKFFSFMNFISRTVHRILKSFTPKNCNFFSLFFWYNFKFLSQNFQFMYPCFSLKFLPLMNFISRTVHQILKSFTPKNCKFFLYFLV